MLAHNWIKTKWTGGAWLIVKKQNCSLYTKTVPIYSFKSSKWFGNKTQVGKYLVISKPVAKKAAIIGYSVTTESISVLFIRFLKDFSMLNYVYQCFSDTTERITSFKYAFNCKYTTQNHLAQAQRPSTHIHSQFLFLDAWHIMSRGMNPALCLWFLRKINAIKWHYLNRQVYTAKLNMTTQCWSLQLRFIMVLSDHLH